MSPLFTVIIIILVVLAVIDLIVGVSNDAVNFLNSALGSKVAGVKTILVVASLGILIGVITSNGMMEVARNGVFHPEMFTFQEVMFLFVGMMMSDVILLNTFNTLGLPTSTTVSLIFELLGAAVAVAMFKVWNDSALTVSDIGSFINSGKALVMISGILISVVLSFAVGSIIMYFSRILFTFRYSDAMKKWGAAWCGISVVGIIYFALIKGLKSSGLITPEGYQYITGHIWLILGGLWITITALLFVAQKLNVNILKFTILSGTFALALAFAGNDLVNFIGVPMAGIDSYMLALNHGSTDMTMEALASSAPVHLWILIISGLIMIVTLFVSKSAMKVAATQLNLSSQNAEEERFGSTGASRAIVRTAIGINHIYNSIIPEGIKRRIDKAFTPLSEEERKDVSYDNIRAVVNLTAAAILICVGTSLKLPLSTTYVVFMVAMGSSLADRAWGRDSAVYRISGVMVVISGWFVTALAGFTIAVVIVTLLMWGGWIALLIIAILCGYALCHNLIFKSKRKEIEDKPMFNAGAKETDVLFSCTEYVCKTMEEISSIYNHMLVAIFTENRRVLKETVEQSEAIYLVAHKKKIEVLSTLKKLQEQNIETAHFYVQVVDYLDEVSKALLHCTRPAYEHIENNHRSLNEEQIIDLKVVNDSVDEIFNKINEMLRNHDFSNIGEIMTMRESLFGIIAESIKNQIKRLKTEDMSTKASALYLNILNETKNMVLQSRNLLKAQAYFLDEIDSEKDKGEEITARS